jgi:multidrug resistance efflux pump
MRPGDARSSKGPFPARTSSKQAAQRVAAANYQGALAALELAQLNLSHATVRAPVAGYVTHLRLRPGDYATAGETKVAVVDAHSFWVVGYFEETKLRHIRIGNAAQISLMGFDPLITGHVESIGGGSMIAMTDGRAWAAGCQSHLQLGATCAASPCPYPVR